MMTRILQFVQGQFKSQTPQIPKPLICLSVSSQKMYLPLIKLSIVFEFLSKLGFVKGTEDELEKNFMSLFYVHAMNIVVAASGCQQK